jgi:PhoH-like ATPase
MAKKNYVLDTSVYLTDADAIFKFENHDIFVPLKVLEEIDNHKKRQDSVGANARKIIRTLDELRSKGSLQKGVRIDKGKGIVRVISYEHVEDQEFPRDLDISVPDHIILASAIYVSGLDKRKTVVVSRDINMRVICDSIGLPAEDYINERVVRSSEELYSGFATHLVDDQVVDRFYAGEDITITEDEVFGEPWFTNQYLLLVSNANEKKTAIARFRTHFQPLEKIVHSKIQDWNISSRNKEQAFAIDLLLDPDVKMISLVGRAGSGKTLCAIAAGLQQTIGLRGSNPYDRMIVSRPVQPLGKDIGFLPGTMEEKMLPWLMPIQDNLQFLLGGDKNALKMYMEKGKIEIEALTYIRGRSIANSFIIIDEAQNLTAHEIKTIMTRVGEGTKIVLTGDIEQIDNVYVNETSNGLAHAVEKFKEFPIAGHVTFTRGERSDLATIASKVL